MVSRAATYRTYNCTRYQNFVLINFNPKHCWQNIFATVKIYMFILMRIVRGCLLKSLVVINFYLISSDCLHVCLKIATNVKGTIRVTKLIFIYFYSSREE